MGDTLPVTRIAVVQAAPVFLDRDASVHKAVGLIREAAGRGAHLVVFPETWLPGYPVWASRVPPLRVDPALRAVWARLWRNAVEVPSDATQALAEAAQRAGVHLVMGVNERDAQFGRGTLFNSILFFGPQGRLLGRHRKLMPTFHERTIWGLGDASGLVVHDTPVGRLGGLVCWEHWMPLARYALAAQGEQLHAALWPATYGQDSVDGQMVQVASRHYAHESRAFVAAAAVYMTRDALPGDFELGDAARDWPHLLLHGGSAIIAPDGRYLAGPAYEGEEVLYADANVEEAVALRASLDVAGHYARPDVLRLQVDRSPLAPVSFEGFGEAAEAAPSPRERTLAEELGDLARRAARLTATELRAAVDALSRKARGR